METGGANVLVIILWILAANVILIASAYGVYKVLRHKAQGTIRQIGEQIQAYAAQMNQLAAFLQTYAGIDQEPFFTPLGALQSEASALQARLQQFLDTCRAFEEQVNTPVSSQPQDIINAPVTSYRRWRHSQELSQESAEIAGQMETAEKRMQTIYELPWELASEARQADQQYGVLVEAAQALQSSGVQGAALQQIINQLPVIQRSLARIPDPFIEADHDALLAAASMETTIQVFQALNSIRPPLSRYLPLAKEWLSSFQKATTDYAELKQTGAKLRQALQSPPEGLVIAPIKARLDQVAQRAADAGQALAVPQAEEIKPLSREINHLLKVIQDTERQYQQAQRQVGELQQVLAELRGSLDQLAAQQTDLRSRPEYPLLWDQSTPLLNDLRQRLEAVGDASAPRTPEQIQQYLKEMQQLRQKAQAQREKAPKTAAQHQQLIAVLETPRIKEGAAWLRKSREMLAETDGFDPKNWPKNDSLPGLQVEMEQLSRQFNQLVPADSARPLKESELDQRLKDTQDLAEKLKQTAPRVDAVRSRLEKLQALEEEGKDRLTEVWNALDQAGLLCRSNPLLEEMAAGEIDQLMEEIRVLGNEINTRDQGEVEKKAQKSSVLVDKVNQAFNQWVARLDGAVAELHKRLQERLQEVDAVVQLDDPQVEQARQALEKDAAAEESYHPSSSTGSSSTGGTRGMVERVTARIPRLENKSALNSLEAMAQIKRKNDLWQTLAAAEKGLEERSAPLLAAYQEALQARTEAKERLAEVERVVKDKRVWPPSRPAEGQDRQALQPAEEKWQGLKKQTVAAEWAILELGRLAQQYRVTAERAQQALDRNRQDQEKAQDLEWQIETLKQRWLTQSDPSNPLLRESIRQLLSQSDSKLAFIKQQYLVGAISYNQAIQNLQLLYEDLHGAKVPVDDKTELGLNETHKRAQQAS